MTLTLSGDDNKNGSTLQAFRKAWPKMRKRINRYRGKFHYVRVLEQHKSGQFHAHLLIDFSWNDIYLAEVPDRKKGTKRVLRSKFVEGHWQDVSGATMTHTENMRSGLGAALYITKYMTKGNSGLPKNVRRLATSQGFHKAEYEDGGVWRMTDGWSTTDLDIIQLDHKGSLISLDEKREISYNDLVDGYWPPQRSE